MDLDLLFSPRSVAVIGASIKPPKRGNAYLRFLKAYGFRGPIYPVNPHYSEVLGLKCYPSLLDIPGPVDYVKCSIPAESVPALAQECVRKGARLLQMFTSGFSETREPERMALESRLVDIARAGNLRLLGPNCMGIYHPKMGLSFNPHSPQEPGHVSVISQSGGNSSDLGRMASVRGLRFSKVISYGNAADLNETELLSYLGRDPDTKVIGAFIEGVRDLPHFQEVLVEVARLKPVAIVKGGETRAGSRAVSAHTGAKAGPPEAWQAMCQTANVVQVASMEELADVLLAFQCLPPPAGDHVAVVGIGGGDAIQAADDCERVGLCVPSLPTSVQAALRQFTPLPGTSVDNPLDLNVIRRPREFHHTLSHLADCPDIHVLTVVLRVDQTLGDADGEEMFLGMMDALEAFQRSCPKPVVVVSRALGSLEAFQAGLSLQQRCDGLGVPVYPTIGRAANAIAKYVRYFSPRPPYAHDA